MARWIVPAGTQSELDGIAYANTVEEGEIVYNSEDESLQIGKPNVDNVAIADPDGSGADVIPTNIYGTVLDNGEVVNDLIADDTIELVKLADLNAGSVVAAGSDQQATDHELMENQFLTIDSAGDLVNKLVDDASINALGLDPSSSLKAQAANTILANATTSSAKPTEVSVAVDRVVGRDGNGNIDDITVKTNHIADSQVTFGKMQNVSQGTILGRRSADGTGAITALSPADARAVLGLSTGEVSTESRESFSVGDGLDYSSSTGVFSHTDTSSVQDVTDANLQYVSGLSFDTFGHVTGQSTRSLSAGNDIDISATGLISHETFSHAGHAEANNQFISGITLDNGHVTDLTTSSISVGNDLTITDAGEIAHEEFNQASQAEVNNQFISGITLDNGHITGLTTSSISAGDQITVSDSGVIAHANVSSPADVNETAETYVSGVTVDNNGHVTGLTTEGINIASDSQRGLASFSSTDFTVNAAGHVSTNASSIRGDVSASGDGLDYSSSTGVFSHADTSSVADIAEVVNSGGQANINVLTGATFDDFGHVQTMSTETLEDGDNIVFGHGTTGVVEISVPRASTSVRGAAQFNSGDFEVADGLVSLGSIDGGTMIDDHSISLDKLPEINNTGFLGSDEAGETDVEVLTPANVLNLLNLNPGNGLTIDTATSTINVQNLAFSNNYVFTTIANRNAGQDANGDDITWHPGDIAITTTSGTGGVAETWLYIGADGTVGAVTDADFVETTQNPTNLSISNHTANGFTLESSTGSDQPIATATSSLAGLLSGGDKGKLDGVEQSANNYSLNIMATGDSSAGVITNSETLNFTASGAAAVSRSDDTINISATNTTYGAGGGLDLTGTTFSHEVTSSQSSVNNSGRTVIQDITLDGYGHITGINSATLVDTDTTYSGGTGITVDGTTISHSDTSSQSSVNNSGRTVIQDITLDDFGHITGINSATLADTNTDNYVDSASFNTGNGVITLGRTGSLSDLTVDIDGRYSTSDTTYSAGNGISLSGTTFSVAGGTGLTQDASGLSLSTAGIGAGTYGSTADGTKIDQITVDAYGRVTAITTGSTGSTSNTGDITGVSAGTGLTGGGASGSVTLNADIATQAEAETGTNNTKLMTPARVAQAIEAQGSASVTVSDTAPSNPSDGDLWYYEGGSSDPARLYVWIADDAAWVDASPAGGGDSGEEGSGGSPFVPWLSSSTPSGTINISVGGGGIHTATHAIAESSATTLYVTFNYTAGVDTGGSGTFNYTVGSNTVTFSASNGSSGTGRFAVNLTNGSIQYADGRILLGNGDPVTSLSYRQTVSGNSGRRSTASNFSFYYDV